MPPPTPSEVQRDVHLLYAPFTVPRKPVPNRVKDTSIYIAMQGRLEAAGRDTRFVVGLQHQVQFIQIYWAYYGGKLRLFFYSRCVSL